MAPYTTGTEGGEGVFMSDYLYPPGGDIPPKISVFSLKNLHNIYKTNKLFKDLVKIANLAGQRTDNFSIIESSAKKLWIFQDSHLTELLS